jgi:hypothetical protein
MTVAQKMKTITDYCNTTECSECVLKNKAMWTIPFKYDDCLNISLSPETDLDKALALIENKADVVNHPSHYTDGKIEVIDFIEDKKLGFCLGNAIKYIARAGKKDPTKEVEDLKKARWYIERRIKEIEEDIV